MRVWYFRGEDAIKVILILLADPKEREETLPRKFFGVLIME